MSKTIGYLIAFILIGGAAIGYYFTQSDTAPLPPPPVAVVPPTPANVAPVAPAVPKEATVPALPQLKDSDPLASEALSALLGADLFKKYFRLEEIVRHIVVTIDNLPRKTAAARLFPTKPVGGKFITGGDEEYLVISAKNAARYKPYVSMAEKVDAKTLVAAYTSLSPLFQSAYQELGYPTSSFNDRLITVIDHLLKAPEPKGPVRLVQPNVMFQYEDEALEAQSAGSKIMMRIGRDNAAKIKAKLREIRKELVFKQG